MVAQPTRPVRLESYQPPSLAMAKYAHRQDGGCLGSALPRSVWSQRHCHWSVSSSETFPAAVIKPYLPRWGEPASADMVRLAGVASPRREAASDGLRRVDQGDRARKVLRKLRRG